MRRACRIGLTAAVTLSLTAVAAHSAGNVAAAPSGGSYFVPATSPRRLVDTRLGVGAPAGKVAAGSATVVQVAGTPGVPSNAVAAMVNVTAVDASAGGWLQVLPTGRAAVGSSSTLNVDFAGQTIPNASFAPLGDGGSLTVYSTFSSHVLIDVFGYFVPAAESTSGRFVPLAPGRVLDTRAGLGWTPPAPAPASPTARPANPGDSKNCDDFSSRAAAQAWFDTYLPHYGDVAKLDSDGDRIVCESLPMRTARRTENVPAATTISLQITGKMGVPANAAAVVLNVTAADPVGASYVQVAPTPLTIGASSNLNTSPGRTIANLVVTRVGVGGKVDFYTDGPTELIADVVGYFTDATAPSSGDGLFVPTAPERKYDSRAPGGVGAPDPTIPPLAAMSKPVIELGDLTRAVAVTGNLTAAGATPGWAQIAANPVQVGAASSINTAYDGQTVANAVIAGLSADGKAQAYVDMRSHLLLDVTGWFSGGPSPTSTPTVQSHAVGPHAPEVGTDDEGEPQPLQATDPSDQSVPGSTENGTSSEAVAEESSTAEGPYPGCPGGRLSPPVEQPGLVDPSWRPPPCTERLPLPTGVPEPADIGGPEPIAVPGKFNGSLPKQHEGRTPADLPANVVADA